MQLYAHPFSSYCQKALIALYENATPFEYRNLEDAAANAELVSLWPLKRFPVLVDRGRTILEATTIIEHLQRHHPGPVRLVPDGDGGVEVRMLDRVFDNYVMTPMQKIVLDPLRPEPARDAHGVAEARALLDRIYAWLDERLAARTGRRRGLHHGRLRGRAGALLRRLGARDSDRARQPARLSGPPAGPAVRRARGGRGAALPPLLSLGAPDRD